MYDNVHTVISLYLMMMIFLEILVLKGESNNKHYTYSFATSIICYADTTFHELRLK